MDGISIEGTTLKISASGEHRNTVIFLHGLGQSNSSWAQTFLRDFTPHLPHTTWLLPQASPKPVSLNKGRRRPCWFDITTLPPADDDYDEEGVADAVCILEDIILGQVHAGIDSRNIVLAGFSQGAATCLITGLSSLHELGGIVSLSGWIPLPTREHILLIEGSMPILWCHGELDTEVPIAYGHDAMTFLREDLQMPEGQLQLKLYEDLEHATHDKEMGDFLRWLRETLH